MFQEFEGWLIAVTGTESTWWFQVFLVVFLSLVLGYIASRFFNRLSSHAVATKTLWDDAARAVDSDWVELIEPVNRVAVILLLAQF